MLVGILWLLISLVLIWKPFGGDGGVGEEVGVGGAGGVVGSVFR